MEYRIEKGPEYRLTGLSLRANSGDGSNFTDVPALWDAIMRDGRFSALCAKIGGSKLGSSRTPSRLKPTQTASP